MKAFVDQILKNLEMNGFPNKVVSLPTEKMYEIADNKGLNFNQVLESLKSDHQIESNIETERIIFSKSAPNLQNSENNENSQNNEEMMKKAQEAMSKMGPEELSKIQEMFMNMSDEEKEEIMKKGKEMGLI